MFMFSIIGAIHFKPVVSGTILKKDVCPITASIVGYSKTVV